MATRELKWDETRQVFVGSRLGDVYGIEVTLDELPKDAKITRDKKSNQPIKVVVDAKFAKDKLKELSTKEQETLTKEEYEKVKAEGPTGTKTSPLPKQIFSIKVSRDDIVKENNVKIGVNGIPVYIDPETAGADASGQVMVIKPGSVMGDVTQTVPYEVVSAEKELRDVLSSANASKNGIKNLKEKLYYAGFYQQAGIQNQATSRSLATGDELDLEVQTALNFALQAQSVSNWYAIKGGRDAFDLDGWLDFSKAAYAGSLEQKSVNLPSEFNVSQVANDAYLKFMGRPATPNEIMALQAAAYDMARANPDVSSQDLALGAGTTVSQPGFGPDELEAFAEEYVKAQPGGQEWGMGQGGLDTFTGAINMLLRDFQSSRSTRVMPGEKI